jgi:hypothetical protein
MEENYHKSKTVLYYQKARVRRYNPPPPPSALTLLKNLLFTPSL